MGNKKVILLETWKANIGNSFIDIGSEESLREAGLNITAVGGLQKYQIPYSLHRNRDFIKQFIMKAPTGWLEKFIGRYKYRKMGCLIFDDINTANMFDLEEYIDTDYVCVSGCILNNYLTNQFKCLIKLKEKGVKIILNGVSGSDYDKFEYETTSRFLSKLKPDIFISRDPETFLKYSKFAEESYNGIDCGFFVSEAYSPVKLKRSYVVYNFDKLKEPKIKKFSNIVRTHHTPYSFKRRWSKEENVFISDKPEDYFNIYANAQAVFTDRVHACVASKAFGTRYKFYYITPRAKLLERVENSNLKKEKEQQVKFLRDVIQN